MWPALLVTNEVPSETPRRTSPVALIQTTSVLLSPLKSPVQTRLAAMAPFHEAQVWVVNASPVEIAAVHAPFRRPTRSVLPSPSTSPPTKRVHLPVKPLAHFAVVKDVPVDSATYT